MGHNASSYKSRPEAVGFVFFQAEDGIRDYKVTGVQTCALPICRISQRGGRMNYAMVCSDCDVVMDLIHGGNMMHKRSEERRVGKECRSRLSPYH